MGRPLIRINVRSTIRKNDIVLEPGEYRLQQIGTERLEGYRITNAGGHEILILGAEELAHTMLDGSIELLEAMPKF